MSEYLTSKSALAEIAARLKAYRIDSSITQEELCGMSGISRQSLINMEKGLDVHFSSVLKVLIALGLDSNINLLVPNPAERPSYQVNNPVASNQRKRASKNKVKDTDVPFKWGDE